MERLSVDDKLRLLALTLEFCQFLQTKDFERIYLELFNFTS